MKPRRSMHDYVCITDLGNQYVIHIQYWAHFEQKRWKINTQGTCLAIKQGILAIKYLIGRQKVYCACTISHDDQYHISHCFSCRAFQVISSNSFRRRVFNLCFASISERYAGLNFLTGLIDNLGTKSTATNFLNIFRPYNFSTCLL